MMYLDLKRATLSVVAVASVITPVISLAPHANAYTGSVESWAGYQNSTINARLSTPVLTTSDVGKSLTMAIEPVSGASMNGNTETITAQYHVAGTNNWPNATIDWTQSGSWSGRTNIFIGKITADMVGTRVDMHAPASSNVNSATFKGTVQVGTGPSLAQNFVASKGGTVTASGSTTSPSTPTSPTTPVTASAPTIAEGFTTKAVNYGNVRYDLTSRVITSGDVGKRAHFIVKPESGLNIFCDQRGVSVDGIPGGYNARESGCWTGGLDLAVDISKSMVGKKITASGIAQKDGSSTGVLKATWTLGSETKNYTSTVSIVGNLDSSHPAPSITEPVVSSTTLWKIPRNHPTSTIPVGSSRINNLTDGSNLSKLPKDPIWSGGNEYYSKYPDAVKAGWADKNFFPTTIWYSGAGSDKEVKYVKSKGINTYVMMNPANDARLLAQNGMSYVGPAGVPLANEAGSGLKRPGTYLDDEVDGRFGMEKAQAEMKRLDSTVTAKGGFRYANFTGMIYSNYKEGKPVTTSTGAVSTVDEISTDLVNNYTDDVSSDAYWFAGGLCNQSDIQSDSWMFSFTKESCRTPQSYGRNQEALKLRDAADGKYQPVSTYVENLASSMSDDEPVYYEASPEEIKSGMYSTIVHGANSARWFNQSYGQNNKYESGNAIGSAFAAKNEGKNWPGTPYVDAMGALNNHLLSVAPALNTQTTLWNFGAGIDSMFKVMPDGSGYIFAQPTDTGANKGAGNKTFQVPKAYAGKTVTVVGENRTLKVGSDGKFVDYFASMNSFHTYKIA